MTAWTERTSSPFGRALTAVVSPMHDDGTLDLAGLQKVVSHLLDTGHDGVVVNGTTGESATTTDDEQDAILRAALEVVGDRGRVVAGVGTNDTAHTVGLAKQAEATGAHGLLVVTPYYNRPTQPGLLAHFTTVADATGLPVMLYDIPARTGTPIATETLLRLAEHPRIVAVKDAKGDIAASSEVIAKTDLAYYSGDDINLLPLLAVGGIGVVSVCAHVAGPEIASLIAAYDDGRVGDALALHQRLLPVFRGTFRTQGTILTKAALNIIGLPAGPVRLPLVDATPEQIAVLRDDYAAGGITLPS